ncbi:MAG: hypothetical protein JRE28_04320 [Deltaproteobacteria bacterium]|nr:hypothetical protein [Deltaproteobacteria bacterium]
MIEKTHSVQVTHGAYFTLFEIKSYPPAAEVELIKQGKQAYSRIYHYFTSGRKIKKRFGRARFMRTRAIRQYLLQFRTVYPSRRKLNFTYHLVIHLMENAEVKAAFQSYEYSGKSVPY